MFREPPRFRLGAILHFITNHIMKWATYMRTTFGGLAASVHQWALGRINFKRGPGLEEPLKPVKLSKTPDEPLIIFLLGAPGAGKGTQSALLKAAFQGPPLLTHLSYGDLIRYQDKIPGSWVSSFPRRRRGSDSSPPLLSADAAVQLLRETIVEAGIRRYGQRVWLLDGFPRNAEHVAAWVAAQMPPARCAIYLSCPPDTLIQRVLSRSSSSSGRPDDAVPELARERVERHHRESEALLSALAGAGVRVARIDADRDVDTVKKEIHAHFQKAMNDWDVDRSQAAN